MLKAKALATGVPLVLAEATTNTNFDATGIVESAVNNASSQMNGALTIVVPVIAGIAVAVVVVKFGLKWIKKINSAG